MENKSRPKNQFKLILGFKERDQKGWVEKRKWPRFQWPSLVFKCHSRHLKNQMVFAVDDLSLSGMQISLKDGLHTLQKGNVIDGEIRSLNKKWSLTISGKIAWVEDQKIGIEFAESFKTSNSNSHSNSNSNSNLKSANGDSDNENDKNHEIFAELFDLETLVSFLRPMEALPPRAICFLRGPTPIEIFVKENFEEFTLTYFDLVVQWNLKNGLQTATKISSAKRSRRYDSYAVSGGEGELNSLNENFIDHDVLLKIDTQLNVDFIKKAIEIVRLTPINFLPKHISHFLFTKLVF
jgi:hypothetical protein